MPTSIVLAPLEVSISPISYRPKCLARVIQRVDRFPSDGRVLGAGSIRQALEAVKVRVGPGFRFSAVEVLIRERPSEQIPGVLM
jgi:hypothetical protein